MPNKENLIPFKKGEDPRRNTTGENKGSVHIKKKLIKAFQRIHEGTGTSYDELFVQATIKDGIKVDGQSRRIIWQYLEGLPQQNVDMKVTLPEPMVDITKLKDEIQNNYGDKKDSEVREED